VSVLVDANSRIVIQGITGSTGRFFAERMRASGTPVVCGVVPGRGGQEVVGLPVYNSMVEAQAAAGLTASLIVVPPAHVLSAFEEAAAAGVGLAVIYTENVPVHDSIRMLNRSRETGTRLLGPNSAGVVSPGRANLSDLADKNVPEGRIGIVSKSGTITYELLDLLRIAGRGASTVVCLGGDPIVGLEHADVVGLFMEDSETDCIVVVGEIGGSAEVRAVERWRELGSGKPLVGYIAGHGAPPGRRMGHAGAIVGAAGESAQEKSELMAQRGAAVARLITGIPSLIDETLGQGRA
jgi:succinyl-CoA synthetase alpha subunit